MHWDTMQRKLNLINYLMLITTIEPFNSLFV
jgi:hypothetical protein